MQWQSEANTASFEREVIERSRQTPVLVDFWAAWCAPCRVLAPVLEAVVAARGGALWLVKVDIDQSPPLAQQYGIRSIPCVKAFVDGRVVGEVVGAVPREQLEALCARLPAAAPRVAAPPAPPRPAAPAPAAAAPAAPAEAGAPLPVPPSGSDRPPPEWPEIASAGGIQRWIESELRRRGLIEEIDTSRLSDKERKAFKARREEERRVRRVLRKQAWAAYRRGNLVHLGADVFYHDTADVDRFDIDEPAARRQANALPELKDVQALARALELPLPRLRWLAFHRVVDSGTHYRRWTVPKRDGGQRLISAPKPDLMRVQRWIAEHVSEHLPVHGAAHGFLAGRGTVSNAREHAGARVIVKLDLKDFYPTVTQPRVKGIFRKAGYTEQVATLLSLLCTEAPREELVLDGKSYHVALGPRSLPQGAPTSPSLTNTLCLGLDGRLEGIARKLGFRYTRYADDLTFSWRAPGHAPVGKLLGSVRRIVEDEGFALHREKTRVMRAGSRQKVTGLVVNDAPAGHPLVRVPRATVRRLRAAIHNRERGREGKGESLLQLKGLAAYVFMADAARGRELLDRIARIERTHTQEQ